MLKEQKQSSHGGGFPLPPPVPGGSESLEGLGSFVDGLLGDGKIRRDAAASLERMIRAAADGNSSSPSEGAESAPSAPPDPVPGGNEPVTKGDNPPGETR